MIIRTLAAPAALAALVAALPAHASVMLRQELPELSRTADVVARGTVTATRSTVSADGRRIFTLVTLQVAQAWKGSPPGKVEIRVHGGVHEGIGQRVQGEAQFEPGQDVVVFLQRIGPKQGPPLFRVSGMAQGKYTVMVDAERGEVAAPDLSGLELKGAPDLPAVKAVNPSPIPVPQLRQQVQAAVAR